jgi:transposase
MFAWLSTSLGRVLGTEQFPTTLRGYRSLFRWLGAFGQLGAVGVEGTGSWGAGLARFLTDAGVEVIEVNRPNRQARRKRGKSDPADAEAAARAVLAGEAVGTPKAATGTVESIRLLRVARRSAMKARTQAANQVHSVIDTAPEELRAKLIGLKERERITKAARMRSNDTSTPLGAAKFALAALAAGSCSPRRSPSSTLTSPCSSRALRHRSSTSKALGSRQPPRCSPPRATRLRSDRSFAALCGSSPVDASSGRQLRHRLNRGGDRQANCALYLIVLNRLSWDQRSKDYVARRTGEGKTKKEIIRCLKRYVAREVYQAIMGDMAEQVAPITTLKAFQRAA